MCKILKIEKIIGISFFVVIISLVGVQLIDFEPCTYDGYAQSVYVEDDIAYIADIYLGMVIMDVSNPSEPYELGRLELVSDYRFGTHIYVRNQIAYLIGNSKLKLINVSDLSSPSQISSFGANFEGMHVDFPFFYIVSRSGGFRIYNLTDHLNPSQLCYIDLGVTIRDIYYTGNRVYIAYSDGLKIIDTSNLTNPIELGQLYTDDGYRNCVVDGHVAYAIGLERLDIIDVSDPTDPTVMSQFNEGGDFWSGISFEDDTLYVSDWSDGFELIDVTNPLKPFKYAQFKIDFPMEAYIAHPYAYIACAECGFKIVDVSNPSLWNNLPSILNFVITFVSIGVIVVLILLKSIFRRKTYKGEKNG